MVERRGSMVEVCRIKCRQKNCGFESQHRLGKGKETIVRAVSVGEHLECL